MVMWSQAPLPRKLGGQPRPVRPSSLGEAGWTGNWWSGPALVLSPLHGLPRPALFKSPRTWAAVLTVGRDCRRLAPEALLPVGRDCRGLALGMVGLLNECMCPTPSYPA